MLVGVGVSVGTDAMVVVGTGVSVGAGGLVGVGPSQDDIENGAVMAMAIATKHTQEPFLLFIQFMISPRGSGPAKYCPGILHNKQLWLNLITVVLSIFVIYRTSNDPIWLAPFSSPESKTIATCHSYVPACVNLEAETN